MTRVSEERLKALLEEGDRLQRERRFEEAILLYLEATEIAPDQPQSHAAPVDGPHMPFSVGFQEEREDSA